MSRLSHLLRDRRGASAAEFAMVLPLMLILLLGVIDAGRLMWTWNRAEKATQLGVRYAAVTDLVPATLETQNFALTNGIPGGDPVPTSAFSSTSCDNAGCSSWGYNATAFANIVNHIQAQMPEVGPEDVVIDYENVGLGYAGDPHGPDVAPLITVRLRNLQFDPISLMVFGATFSLPDFRAALTAEDGDGTVSN